MYQLNQARGAQLLCFSILFFVLFLTQSIMGEVTLKKDLNKSEDKQTVQTATIQRKNLTTEQTAIAPPVIKFQESSKLAGEQINWSVLSSGSTDGSSTNFRLLGSVGQIAVGSSTSANFIIKHGFWQIFSSGGCCINTRGNANNDPGDLSNIADITFLVSYLFGIPGGPAPACIEEANSNSDPAELANIADITFLVNYLFGVPTGPAPGSCP